MVERHPKENDTDEEAKRQKRIHVIELVKDATMKKIDFYLSKKTYDEQTLYSLIRGFFIGYLASKSQLTYEEIGETLENIPPQIVKVSETTKEKAKSYLKKISELEYDGIGLTEQEFVENIRKFKSLVEELTNTKEIEKKKSKFSVFLDKFTGDLFKKKKLSKTFEDIQMEAPAIEGSEAPKQDGETIADKYEEIPEEEPDESIDIFEEQEQDDTEEQTEPPIDVVLKNINDLSSEEKHEPAEPEKIPQPPKEESQDETKPSDEEGLSSTLISTADLDEDSIIVHADSHIKKTMDKLESKYKSKEIEQLKSTLDLFPENIKKKLKEQDISSAKKLLDDMYASKEQLPKKEKKFYEESYNALRVCVLKLDTEITLRKREEHIRQEKREQERDDEFESVKKRIEKEVSEEIQREYDQKEIDEKQRLDKNRNRKRLLEKIENLFENIQHTLEQGSFKEAHRLYFEIWKTYIRLDDDAKKTYYYDLHKLYKTLKAVRKLFDLNKKKTKEEMEEYYLQAKRYFLEEKYGPCREAYDKLMDCYDRSQPSVKKEFYEKVYVLYNNLLERKIEKKTEMHPLEVKAITNIKKANYHINNQEKGKAKEHYQKAMAVYKQLHISLKRKYFPQLQELYEILK